MSQPQHSDPEAARLAGRCALVTAADGRVGRDVAVGLAHAGADVVLAYRDRHEDAQATAGLVEAEGRQAVLVAGDPAQASYCRRVVDVAMRRCGRLDAVIVDALPPGISTPWDEFDDAEWDHAIRVGISAMFHVCKAASPYLQPGATIIAVTSDDRERTMTSLPDAVIDAGVRGLTVCLSALLGDRGVSVQAVPANERLVPTCVELAAPGA